MIKTFFTILLFNFILTPLNAQWEFLNEGFCGKIRSIDFVSEDVGWIAGDNGTLLTTVNSGDYWRTIVINEYWYISQIDFINENTGWAIGRDENYEGIILCSNDGGDSWTVQKQIDTTLNSLFAIDDNKVFVAGREGLVLSTIDGGINWNIHQFNQDYEFSSVWFIDSDIGVVLGSSGNIYGLVLKTINGGNDWEETSIYEFNNLIDLQFVDNVRGYFTARYDTSFFLCKTNDLLESWNIIMESPYVINSFHLLDSSKVYAITKDSLSIDNIIRSTDAGNTWQKLKSFEIFGNEFDANKIFFNNLATGYFIAAEPKAGTWSWDYEHSFLYRTTDSGSTWGIQKFSYPAINIFFNTTNSGFISGGFLTGAGPHIHGCAGHLFSTTDGGNNWKINLNVESIIRKVLLFDNSKGLALASVNAVLNMSSWYCFEVYNTNDGGANWSLLYKINPDTSEFWFSGNDVGYIDDGAIWIVGSYVEDVDDNGAGILESLDGGISWSLVKKIQAVNWNEYDLNSISVYDEIAWSVGEKGMIVEYSNPASWVEKPAVTDLPLNKVIFANESVSLISGGYINSNEFEHIMLKTTNAGETWESNQSLPYLINDMYFINSTLVWAVGTDEDQKGVILVTTNAGDEWFTVVDNLRSPLNSLAVKDNYAWAIGEDGIVLISTDNGANWVDDNNKIYPTEFKLEQNYPNPFNPSTTIKYHIPKQSFVTLKIYDVLGNEIETLVNKEQPQGVYEIEFDANTLSSGVYLYKLETETFSETKKMILLK